MEAKIFNYGIIGFILYNFYTFVLYYNPTLINVIKFFTNYLKQKRASN